MRWRPRASCWGPAQRLPDSMAWAAAFVIAHLAFAEQHDDGASLIIAYGVQLGVQATFRAPDTSGNRPFFKRLAAVRCAFRCVASIISRDGLPALRASSANILLNTLRRLQRTNRLNEPRAPPIVMAGWRQFGLAASIPSFGRSLLLRDTAQIELSSGRAEPCKSKAINAPLPGQEFIRIQTIPATGFVQR